MLGPTGVQGQAGAPKLPTPKAKPVPQTPAIAKPPEPVSGPGPFDDLLVVGPSAPIPATPQPMPMHSSMPAAQRKAMTQTALQKAGQGMFP